MSFIFLVLLLFATLCQCADRNRSFKKIHGFKKSADILDTLQVNRALECAGRCITRHGCAAYNFLAHTNGETTFGACELAQKGDDNTMVTAATGWDMFVGKCTRSA